MIKLDLLLSQYFISTRIQTHFGREITCQLCLNRVKEAEEGISLGFQTSNFRLLKFHTTLANFDVHSPSLFWNPKILQRKSQNDNIDSEHNYYWGWAWSSSHCHPWRTWWDLQRLSIIEYQLVLDYQLYHKSEWDSHQLKHRRSILANSLEVKSYKYFLQIYDWSNLSFYRHVSTGDGLFISSRPNCQQAGLSRAVIIFYIKFFRIGTPPQIHNPS